MTIITDENSASCGIVGNPGDVLGIMAYVDDPGRLASNICQVLDAETPASAIFEGETSLSISAVTLEELNGTFTERNEELAPLFVEPATSASQTPPRQTRWSTTQRAPGHQAAQESISRRSLAPVRRIVGLDSCGPLADAS